MTSSPVQPAQLISCLSEAPNVATYYTDRAGLFTDFIGHVTSNVQDMDAMYVVSWGDWFPKSSQCMPVSVMKPGDEDECDDDGEGRSDSGLLVEPPALGNKKTPTKLTKPQDPGSSDDEEEAG